MREVKVHHILEPGPELDSAIAREVMGWQQREINFQPTNGTGLHYGRMWVEEVKSGSGRTAYAVKADDTWSPSMILNHTEQLIEYLRQNKWTIAVAVSENLITCKMACEAPRRGRFEAEGESIAHAVALAAYKAVGLQRCIQCGGMIPNSLMNPTGGRCVWCDWCD